MKITAWNGEWLDHAWGVVSGKYQPGQALFPNGAPGRAEATARVAATADLMARIAPDILFICEGPETEAEAAAFADHALPGLRLVTRPAGDASHVKGTQGMWFFLRATLWEELAPQLVPVPVWRAHAAARWADFAAEDAALFREEGKWQVAMPLLRKFGSIRDVPVSERNEHEFHRHPQTLRLTIDGKLHEVIGLHLKSKHVRDRPRRRKSGESFASYAKAANVRRYLALSHQARIKLSSEAQIVRAYVDHRFDQDADPAIFIVGDVNDGPGKEVMEREFLLHDMIGNLQGDVFFADRFLNHALFDQPQHLRWTAEFHDDPLDPGRNPRILLDHIMFTQALTRGGSGPLWVPSGSGTVEHLAQEEVAALHGAAALSDHRPVSVTCRSRGG